MADGANVGDGLAMAVGGRVLSVAVADSIEAGWRTAGGGVSGNDGVFVAAATRLDVDTGVVAWRGAQYAAPAAAARQPIPATVRTSDFEDMDV